MSMGAERHHGCRISDEWKLAGMRTIILENELLRVVVLVDKGSDIIEFRYKPLDLDFLLHMPNGVRNPGRELPSIGGSPFIDYYSGGWNEVLPNGGPSASYKGADFGQHGEVSLLPWKYAILQDSPGGVAVRMWVRPLRTPFYLEKTLSMQPGRAVLNIEETLVNEGGEPLHCMWGQHIAFGRPFLDEGARIDAPAGHFIVHAAMPGYEPRRFQPDSRSGWPIATAPDGAPVDVSIVPAFGDVQAQEMAYITGLEDGWYAITNPARKVGFGVHFDASLYRYIWYWAQYGNVAQGYPWWGRTHTIALEPWTSYPTNGLPDAVANGSALLLQAGESRSTRLCAVAYAGLEQVRQVTGEGRVAA